MMKKLTWFALLIATSACFGCDNSTQKGRAGSVVSGQANGDATAAAQLIRDLDKHRDVTLSVTTGTEHFGKGLVKLSVRGDGSVTVLNRNAGTKKSFTYKLTTEELAALGRELAEAGFTTVRSPGPPREPGDTPVVLEVTQGGKEHYRAELWDADRYNNPGLDKIIKRNDALVTKITKGELPY